MKRRGRRRRNYGLVRYQPISYGGVGGTRRKKRRRRRVIRELLSVFACALLVILVLSLIGGAGLFLYWRVNRPVFGEGEIRICMEDGGYEVTWPALRENDRCRLYTYETEQKTWTLCGEYDTEAYLPLPPDGGGALRLRLQAVRETEILGISHVFKGEKKEVSVDDAKPGRPVLTKSAGADPQRVSLFWTAVPGCEYQVFQKGEDGSWELYAQDVYGMVELDFVHGIAMPDRDHPVCLAVREGRREGGCLLYGELSDPVYIQRSELMEEGQGLSCGRIDVCQYILRWEEGKGRYYALQQWSDTEQDWVTMATYDWTQELSYETGRLPSGTQVSFRVVTYDTENQREEGQFVDEPLETTFRTEYSTYYCTVWPIMPLNLLESADGENALAQVPAGEALCVLGEQNGRFRVRYRDTYGYVDARYCLINLSEYLGNLCAYDIANGYDSIFRVHGYEIPGITGTVVKGYEGVQLEDGTFLVPYLYPCAKKLIAAAEAVREDGYYLRIFDAFRPNEATRFLYDTTELLLDLPVPKLPADGEEETKTQEPGEETDGTAAVPDDQQEQQGQQEPDAQQEPDGQEEGDGEKDLYGGLEPEVIALLSEKTPEELTAMGLPAETVQRLDIISGQTVTMLRNLSEEEFQVFQVLSADLLAVTGFFLPRETDGQEEEENTDAQIPQETELPSQETEDPSITADFPTPEQIALAYGMTPEQMTAVAVGYGLTPDLLQKLSVMTRQELIALKELTPDQMAAFRSYLQGNTQTFYTAMTDGRYRLGSFLAAETSAHNRGIALDLTLERIDTGESLTMQTDMHDLSWHSALPYNNENADLLAKYMKGIGFHDLTSEWWHFQDDETRNELGLNTYLASGLEITGWKKDDRGWKYRQEDGSYFTGGKLTVDGREYTFDEEGYCVEETGR